MTPEQIARRSEFLAGIAKGIAASTVEPDEKLDLHLARSYVQAWHAGDWPDLKAEARNQLTVWVEKYLYNIQQFQSQTLQRKANLSQYSLTLLKDIRKLMAENGIRK